jgi:imidazole glycerol-phosphate synthase subunit HisH
MSGVTAIVDYDVGNLHSVRHALEKVGAQVVVTRDPQDLRAAERLVLPGVGAFGACMSGLLASDLLHTLSEEVLHNGKPLLGICVGMQILATAGEEDGRHAGLGWIPGRVRRLVPEGGSDVRVPHMGWNDTRVCRSHPVLAGLSTHPTFYFVHSYIFEPSAPEHVIATCDYGQPFASIVAKDNIIATQFHPEKSQADGFAFLEGFLRWQPQAVPPVRQRELIDAAI